MGHQIVYSGEKSPIRIQREPLYIVGNLQRDVAINISQPIIVSIDTIQLLAQNFR